MLRIILSIITSIPNNIPDFALKMNPPANFCKVTKTEFGYNGECDNDYSWYCACFPLTIGCLCEDKYGNTWCE